MRWEMWDMRNMRDEKWEIGDMIYEIMRNMKYEK